MEARAIRRRVLAELGLLAALTVLYLSLVPERPMLVDLSLALLALFLLLANRRFTLEKVWGLFPAAGDSALRVQRAWISTALFTGVPLAVFLALGLALGHREGGWAEAGRRVLNPNLLMVMLAYLPWALLQQTLFQLYLLGRMLVLVGAPAAIAITGLAYSLVHLPELPVTLVTALAGVVWSGIYCRHRRIAPLALSHALLGSTFYYWVLGIDLAARWF